MMIALRSAFAADAVRPDHVGLADSTPEETSACAAAWARWRKTYGGRTPFVAHNKNVPDWPFNEEQVKSILAGEKPKFEYQTPLTILGKPYSPAEVYDLTINNERTKRDERFKRIRNSMDYNLRGDAPPDELVIVLTGRDHSDDFFLFYPDANLFYASTPFGVSTTLGNQDYTKVQKILRGLGYKTKTVHDPGKAGSAIVLSSLGALHSAVRDKVGSYQASEFFAETDPDSQTNRIVLGEFHHTDSAKVAEELPSPRCLQILGFSKVRLVLEGADRKPGGYTEEELRKAMRLDTKATQISEFKKVEAVLEQAIARWEGKDPEKVAKLKAGGAPLIAARKQIEELNPEFDPLPCELIRKLGAYSKQGVQVSLQGLEIPDSKTAGLLAEWAQLRSEIQKAKPSETMNDPNLTRLRRRLSSIVKTLERDSAVAVTPQ